jgi:hypothetical protein
MGEKISSLSSQKKGIGNVEGNAGQEIGESTQLPA